MTKVELVAKVSEKAGLTKADVEKALNGFIATVEETLASGGEISLVGFGSFSVGERTERDGRNPQTGEAIKISAARVVKFKVGKGLKDAVNCKK